MARSSSFADAAGSLSRVPGVTRVVDSDRRGSAIGCEVESAHGHDVRRELARSVVSSGWGLLELRPMRISLEEIFLSLTTEETQNLGADATAGEPANA